MTDMPEGRSGPHGPRAYDSVSRFNHWIVAAAMLGMLASGLAMEELPLARETVGEIRGWHKAIGVLVLVYGAWRVGWRLRQGFPPPAAPLPKWQETASKVVHWALLALILLMPLSGIVMSLYSGRAIDVFGLAIPSPGKVEWLAKFSGNVHAVAGKALLVLVALHIGAALKHHIVDRDGTLRRMTGTRPAPAKR